MLRKTSLNHAYNHSLERVQGYIDIEQEPKPTSSGVPPAYWPASGDLRVEKLSARYSEVLSLFFSDFTFTQCTFPRTDPKFSMTFLSRLRLENISALVSPRRPHSMSLFTLAIIVGRTGSGKVRNRHFLSERVF